MTPQNQLTHQVLVHHPLARNPGYLCSSILPRVSRIQVVLQSRFYPVLSHRLEPYNMVSFEQREPGHQGYQLDAYRNITLACISVQQSFAVKLSDL